MRKNWAKGEALSIQEMLGKGLFGCHVSKALWISLAALSGRLTDVQLAKAQLRRYLARERGYGMGVKYLTRAIIDMIHEDMNREVQEQVAEAQRKANNQVRLALEYEEHKAKVAKAKADAGKAAVKINRKYKRKPTVTKSFKATGKPALHLASKEEKSQRKS